MDPTAQSWIVLVGAGGVIAGLSLLARGLSEYRSSIRVGDTSTSPIASLAAGEVRVSGNVEPAELTLVSLLQSRPCVYYRSAVGAAAAASPLESDTVEERSIGFRVRDATGSIRIFPRGGRFDAPVRFDEETGTLGEEPPGLDVRTRGATQSSELDRETAVAELLRVHDPLDHDPRVARVGHDRRRRYREARLEPGDAVTIVGRALPFADLDDPVLADYGSEADRLEWDPEIAADLAAARANGTLTLDPALAWGNAAIAGFGIGRPVSAPDLEAGATTPPLATREEASRIERTFAIAPETLVLAASAEVPLLIAYGDPGTVVRRGNWRTATGLLGAILAIISAMILAVALGGSAP